MLTGWRARSSKLISPTMLGLKKTATLKAIIRTPAYLLIRVKNLKILLLCLGNLLLVKKLLSLMLNANKLLNQVVIHNMFTNLTIPLFTDDYHARIVYKHCAWQRLNI